MADIDTQELNGECQYERDLAIEARDRLRALLNATPFELEAKFGRDRDRYWRLLRIVIVDGHSVGDTLVSEGLARRWTGRRESWC